MNNDTRRALDALDAPRPWIGFPRDIRDPEAIARRKLVEAAHRYGEEPHPEALPPWRSEVYRRLRGWWLGYDGTEHRKIRE